MYSNIRRMSDQTSLFIVMVGAKGVGKTSLLKRMRGESWDENEKGTESVQFGYKMVECDGEYVNVKMWDTSGQETL